MPDRPGRDYLTVSVPDAPIGRGEVDLWVRIAGHLSNVVRVNFGAAPAAPPPVRTTRALLGRYLFYERRMSFSRSTSCATCHRQELAFTDGQAHAIGASGAPLPRSTMSLVNVAYTRLFTWSDPTVHSLEQLAINSLYARDPVEFGLDAVEPQFLRLLRSDPLYRPLFPRAFPGEANPYTIPNVARAIAAFERTIVGADSPWDRFHYGDRAAISESAKRGEILFFTDGGPQCFRCHSGFNFSSEDQYHNTALYDPYPPPNLGLFVHTRRIPDAGKFKAPTLRNIAVTAPYMHDGSIATLEEVLDHYAAGGRAHTNSGRDPLVRGFAMTPQNRADLVAFLKSLTDEGLLHDPRFANPWPR
jgi:cytochrome c peroxidase